MFIEMKAIYRG